MTRMTPDFRRFFVTIQLYAHFGHSGFSDVFSENTGMTFKTSTLQVKLKIPIFLKLWTNHSCKTALSVSSGCNFKLRQTHVM